MTASTVVRQRLETVKTNLKAKTKPSGWILPKQSTSFSDKGTYSNIDMDVTPEERRTWTSLTIFGFWISDSLNAQGWMAPASIIALGLTWREAIYSIILGLSITAIPLVLNGAIGAHLHVPFPVAVRSSFGFFFARFAVIVRMITALFWHAIQTYTGSTAMTQIIRAIWPSYLNIPNHLPASAGITSQQLLSHFIFWSVQFPILLIPPHKLKWFFVFKVVVTVTASVGTVVAMTVKAGGSGDIWNQEYQVHGSERSWLILASMMSVAGGWATMATNVPDFTRYLKNPRGVYWQGFFLPFIATMLGIFGIISCSAAKVVYGEYIWDPLTLASKWEGPAGRCGAFFVGFCWVVAQIGTNLSANVISYANDMVSLFPKYISIRRGVIFATIIAGWAMVPWKIVSSAQSLLTFMAGLAIFLAPISAILACDYWLVKRRHIDVPSLYRRNKRYHYWHGFNWRAALAFLVSVTPNIPGLAQAVNPDIKLSAGIVHLYDINYIYGLVNAAVLYYAVSYFFPAKETLLPESIYDDDQVVEGVEYDEDGEKLPNKEEVEISVEPRKHSRELYDV
ncbi:hypothetical protein M409DRAFT_21546 [Zasmidium cellare ATCC 36951]|uniref:Uncharacterized protein n=1 Tax=Zasmidium cellare ATCC 36951 TaxID=1080233 RepID=A0A6A6CM34_ZASCE|nr:uncharacterized protein M409DRAFT_21546 [Zasmidium cellare ATCC 36951]KAF2168101.1 hypothetical protein M409DRAFT_21546 [Zasmidium cellare ATCC 36951]